MGSIAEATTRADRAIAGVVLAANALAGAKAQELELEQQRPLIKSEAISRIMALPDPQKDGKLYSATAADALVGTDVVYAQHLRDMAQAAAGTIRAAGIYEAAKLTARLYVSKGEVEGFEPLRLALDAAHRMELR